MVEFLRDRLTCEAILTEFRAEISQKPRVISPETGEQNNQGASGGRPEGKTQLELGSSGGTPSRAGQEAAVAQGLRTAASWQE